MGIKITSIRDAVHSTGLKILVHGEAGTGKTVFCATGGVPTLIISAEAGLLSIKDAPDYIETVAINNIDDLENIALAFQENAPELQKYKWVCLDSVSEIAEKVLTAEREINKDARQAYGNLADRMFKIIKFFRDLENRNVLMTCKQQRREDQDTGIATYVPHLEGKKLTQGISYLFDEVFAIRVEKDEESGEPYHILQCHKDRKYEAKDRSGELEMFELPSLKKIAAKILGHEISFEPDEKVLNAEINVSDLVDEAIKEESPELEKAATETLEEESLETTIIESNESANNEVQETEELEEGYEIAQEKLFWIHPESDSCDVIEKGEKFNAQKMSEQLAEIVDEEQYNTFKKQVEEAETKVEEEKEVAAEVVEEIPEGAKTFACCDCDTTYESVEEPEACTNGDCTSREFYEA